MRGIDAVLSAVSRISWDYNSTVSCKRQRAVGKQAIHLIDSVRGFALAVHQWHPSARSVTTLCMRGDDASPDFIYRSRLPRPAVCAETLAGGIWLRSPARCPCSTWLSPSIANRLCRCSTTAAFDEHLLSHVFCRRQAMPSSQSADRPARAVPRRITD